MTSPIPNVSISTPYGKRGSYWSCNPNSSGQGVHTGADFACSSGTRIYAPIDGQIRHRNYGSAFGNHQFAISPDPGQAFADGEVFFAHTRTRLADGVYVHIGDFIAEVGSEGNSTGPHLHLEYHPDTKKVWNCSVHADPKPVLDHGASTYVTKNIYTNKLGYGEPTNGDSSSDTIKELQNVLNHISLVDGQTLEITGRYDTDTDEEVRLWQDQIANDPPDPVNKSYLGPNQTALMFASPPYVIHDTGLPAIAGGSTGTPPPTTTSTGLGKYLKEQGFVVHDSDVPYGRTTTWRGVSYLMVHHTASSNSSSPQNDANYIKRGNADAPLSQLMLDRNGEVWICCQEHDGQKEPGRASHAGTGSGYGIPDNTMNEYSLGIECQNDGKTPLANNPTQYNALIDLLVALTKKYSISSVEKIIGHKEWSTTGKVDPLDNMEDIRNDVYSVLYDDDTTAPIPDEFDGYAWTKYSGKPGGVLTINASDGYVKLDCSTAGDPEDGIVHHMLYVNLELTWSGSQDGDIRLKFVRDGGDATAYQDYSVRNGKSDFLITHGQHWEAGEKDIGGDWYINVGGGITKAKAGTRYVKSGGVTFDQQQAVTASINKTVGIPVNYAKIIFIIITILTLLNTGVIFGFLHH